MNNETEVREILIENIVPNRFQPRIKFDEKELNELAASIKEHGIIQPLIVRPLGDKFEIIAGERRFRGAMIAGLQRVPAIIKTVDDNKSAEFAIIENLQRKDLNSIEEAKAYKNLLDNGMTQEQVATRMGISQPTIANKVRLLNLEPNVQEALLNNQISERHARSLLRIEEPTKQKELLEEIVTKRLTVKKLDEIIKESLTKEEPLEKIDIGSPTVDIPNLDFNLNDLTPDRITEEPKIEETPKENISKMNPFQDSEILDFGKELEQLKQEEQIIPQEKTVEKPKDLFSVINLIRDNNKLIEDSGFKIKAEEFDFEDMYQVIIKIDKK